MVRKCCLCKTSVKIGEQRSFHRIPKKWQRRKLWKVALGNDIIIGDNTFVCSDHFALNDFVTKPSGIKYLREAAVPIIASVSASTSIRCIKEENVMTPKLFGKPANQPISSTINTSRSLPAIGNNVVYKFIGSSTTFTLPQDQFDMDLLTSKNFRILKKRRYPQYFDKYHTSDMDSPKKSRNTWNICKKIQFGKKKIQLQRKKIKNLQKVKNSLRARISSLNSFLMFLKNKYKIIETT